MNNNFKLMDKLSSKNAPRVFTPSSFLTWLKQDIKDQKTNNNGKEDFLPSRRYLTNILKNWSKVNIASRITHGVFLNNMCFPKPTLMEATPYIRKDAVVSLQKVLGDCGVLNNPTDWITCVMPSASGITGGKLELDKGVFQFSTISKKMFPNKKDDWYNDAIQEKGLLKIATPEKALLDWIYLASLSNGHKWSYPPLHDIDMDMLDEDVLEKLSKKMNLDKQLKNWMNGKYIYSSISKNKKYMTTFK